MAKIQIARIKGFVLIFVVIVIFFFFLKRVDRFNDSINIRINAKVYRSEE